MRNLGKLLGCLWLVVLSAACATGPRAVPVEPDRSASAPARPVAPEPPESSAVPREVDPSQARCLALSMYWEAKGEGRSGMRAVGHVVLNRAADERFPSTPCEVVYHGGAQRGCQFSWYCDGRSDEPREERPWAEAQALARELLSGGLSDTTRGALFFHARRIRTPWSVPRTRTVTVGNHVFYR